VKGFRICLKGGENHMIAVPHLQRPFSILHSNMGLNFTAIKEWDKSFFHFSEL